MNSSWNNFNQALTNPLVWITILIVCNWLVIYHGFKYSFNLKRKQMYWHPRKQKWKFCSLWQRLRLKAGWTTLKTANAQEQLEAIWKGHSFWYDEINKQWKTTLKIRRVVFVYKFCYFFGGITINLVLLTLMAWLMI